MMGGKGSRGTKGNKGGRPALPPEKKKRYNPSFRCDQILWDKINTAAMESGYSSYQEFVRDLVEKALIAGSEEGACKIT